MKTPSFPGRYVALILFGSAVCSSLPASAQAPPPANPVCANGGSIRCGCRPCSSPSSRNQPPAYTPPPPPDNSEALREAEIARAREAAEERARIAAEEKLKQEKFEKDKADALKSLKGVSTNDLRLKGVDDNPTSFRLKGFDGAAGEFRLKGIDEAATSSGLSGTSGIYWRTVSVPTACVIAGQLKASAGCSVLDALRLVNALNHADGTREFERLLLEKAAERAVVMTLAARKKTWRASWISSRRYTKPRRGYSTKSLRGSPTRW